MERKIGIMGGTFDPIHLGHLILAEETRIQLNLDKVVFIPTGEPPHKKNKSVLEPIHRYEMTLLATTDNPNFQVSALEIKKEGVSYTIDTMKYLKSLYSDSIFYFITGADSLVNITSWRNADELLTLCKFVTTKRRGIPNSELDNAVRRINEKYGETVYLLSIPYIEISSTDIRNRVKNGESIRYYVPDSVETYIRKNNFYR
ncbi:nicotinate-nucleotide adenylyltransferase [Anaerosalibacter sp. Marseille-P3206]|uniref:nicotinate-nucleotide adenylyltransferase n=1 Tax=Anaerosalibacter sp. Marseille-P3206 TaxID=1871005 RepID=UPI0009858201|nr:nicotinate-nucleotide adenylyltransferase [Anaerosalibacter sp. Marseille-P3206]